jgi:hypothetical protein
VSGVSSPKNGISRLKKSTRKGLVKMPTRKGLVAKKLNYSVQNVDENGPRRQKGAVLGSKCRRERVSSSKRCGSRLKISTRTGLVVKKLNYSAQNADEKRSRRQKVELLGSKC